MAGCVCGGGDRGGGGCVGGRGSWWWWYVRVCLNCGFLISTFKKKAETNNCLLKIADITDMY